jgi:alkylation response protein AidB-like acyl-CoA dehydrogenase
VEVPVANLVGKENEGFGIIMSSELNTAYVLRAAASDLAQTSTTNGYG